MSSKEDDADDMSAVHSRHSSKEKRSKQITEQTVGMSDEEEADSFFGGSNNIEEIEADAQPESQKLIPDENLSCGRGVRKDWSRTVGTHWVEEMTNFRQKTVAVTIFMFFAAIAPAITFGAIYEKTTGHYIGTIEMIASTAWVGIVYCLIGGQPIMINGGTGPILAFSGVLFKLSKTLDVPFLTLSAWVGIWVMVFNAMAAFANLNRFILYATRFTDEIFALLISVIFIIDSLGDPFAPVGLYYYFTPSHDSHENQDSDYSYMATAFWSLILALGTTVFAIHLKGVQFGRYFYSQKIRSTISDFAVTLAILFFTFLDHCLFTDTETEKLNVPDSFEPTFKCCTSECSKYWPEDCLDIAEAYGPRPWLVDLSDLNGKTWVPFMAAGPAFLAFILVFLDDGITLHLINHPSHHLTHGDAYNLNTLIIGVLVGVNSIFGFPWLVAATVRSLNHLHALADKTQEGKFENVLETRLSNLFVHILILCTLFVLPVLKLIPVPVLYGVFLFMGLTSLSTNQFWGRILMIFMETSRYPIEHYTEHVRPLRMHLYTAIQLFMFCILFTVKSIKLISIAFPVVIASAIPLRMFLLPKIFDDFELILLDSEDAEIEEWVRKTRHEGSAEVEIGSDE